MSCLGWEMLNWCTTLFNLDYIFWIWFDLSFKKIRLILTKFNYETEYFFLLRTFPIYLPRNSILSSITLVNLLWIKKVKDSVNTIFSIWNLLVYKRLANLWVKNNFKVFWVSKCDIFRWSMYQSIMDYTIKT